ncbi:MAG: TrbG/VirB9 family P-type conjugative transfer protein, partial [Rhizobiales bacterium]|nr:TrbG/VirB9 family P-type conjugative transfer protein [Hyphomicrobiales bacterium]
MRKKELRLRSRRTSGLVVLLVSATALAGCAKKYIPPQIDYDDAAPAVRTSDPVGPVKVVEVPKTLPLPGQLKPVDGGKNTVEATDPKQRIAQANEAARMQPVRNGFINAVQVYPFTAGALYQVYAAPGQVTDIALQPGEELVGSGPVAAGDTVRWIIGDTVSGSGAT